MNLQPDFPIALVTTLTRSSSIVASTFGRNSTTVVSTPSLEYTPPSSIPMMPPPMTSEPLGQRIEAHASFAEMIRLPSY
jgi:hypothetical protein